MPSARPKLKPVSEMTIQEMKERHAYNIRRLRESYVFLSFFQPLRSW
jgi:hypothetical protein